MKKGLFVTLLIIISACLVFTGFAMAEPKGTFTATQNTFSFESMDPIQFESFFGWAMYDSLLSYDKKGNIIPSLAENYTLSPDGITVF